MNDRNPYSRSGRIPDGSNLQSGRLFDIRDTDGQSPSGQRIDCMKCKHYYVTWEPSFPRGCRLFQFKSKQLPCDVVFSSTGQPCQQFEKRKAHKPKADS